MRLIDADEVLARIENPYQRAEIARWLMDAPTIERKTGKWIKGKCSNCGAHAPFWPMASTYYESDFCPNCGAEMQERREDE